MDITLLSEWMSKYNRFRSSGRLMASGQVLRPGITGNMAAGRDLTVADFTSRGLAAPWALWNFNNNLNDSSGNGFTLTNAGAVTFGSGIEGAANTAAVFNGSSTSYLTAVNAIKAGMDYGSLGCWFKVARIDSVNGVGVIWSWQNSAMLGGWRTTVGLNGRLYTIHGTSLADLSNYWSQIGFGRRKCLDNAWHFLMVTWDGSRLVTYLDGEVDIFDGWATGSAVRGASVQPASSLFCIGAIVNPSPAGVFYGSLDEMFFTRQVLNLEQYRWLYAKKVPYSLPIEPTNVEMTIERHQPVNSYVAADFPTQPKRGITFKAGALGVDSYGSLGGSMTVSGSPTAAPGPDGREGESVYLGATPYYTMTDTGLPTSDFSMGGWAQINNDLAAFRNIACYGTRRAFYYQITSGRCHWDPGNLAGREAGDFYADGRWHFFVVTNQSGAPDGAFGKMYVDGVLIDIQVAIATMSLAGATGFRVGIGNTGADLMYGNISTAFVCDYVLTPEQIFKLYAKPGIFLDRGPVDATSFVEAITDTHIYLIADTLDPRATIELRAL